MSRSSVGVPSTSRYTYDASRGPSIEHEGPRYRRRVLALGAFLGVVSIVNIAMCCYYSYIGGGCTSTNLSDTTNSDFPSSVIEYLQNGKGLGIHTCPFTEFGDVNATGYFNPSATWEACMVNSNNPNGKMQSAFTTSMAFTGQQTLVYTWLAFAILYRSLCHYEWLLSTIAFMMYAILGVVGYYSFSPFLPYPHQTAATVASLTKYIKPDMYDDSFFTYTYCSGAISSSTDQRACSVFDSGQTVPTTQNVQIPMDNCDKAYHYNVAFLIVQYISVFIVLCLLVIAFSAERIRRRYPLSNQLPPLKGTFAPVVITVICLVSYATMIFSKGSASLTTLSVMTDSDSPSSVFPFAQGSVDIATVFLIVTTMSVIRGTTRSSTSAFRLAAVTAILHVSLVYPSIVGNLEVMLYNKIWNLGEPLVDVTDPSAFSKTFDQGLFGSGCRGFWNTYFLSFYNDQTSPDLVNEVKDDAWVHPNEEQVDALCWDTWISFIAQSTIFVFMHIQVIACSMVYKQNKGRPTDVYDPQLPTAPADPRQEPLLPDGDGHVIGRI